MSNQMLFSQMIKKRIYGPSMFGGVTPFRLFPGKLCKGRVAKNCFTPC